MRNIKKRTKQKQKILKKIKTKLIISKLIEN